jgi:hypothetical protein
MHIIMPKVGCQTSTPTNAHIPVRCRYFLLQWARQDSYVAVAVQQDSHGRLHAESYAMRGFLIAQAGVPGEKAP